MDPKHQDTNVNAFPMLDQIEKDRQGLQEEYQSLQEGHSKALGDITQIWDTCGWMGLCPECRRKGATQGCQRQYMVDTIRGVADG